MNAISKPALRIVLHVACAKAGSQSAFAAKAGFSSAYISDVLAGRREPSERLAEDLGYSRSTIFTKREANPLLDA